MPEIFLRLFMWVVFFIEFIVIFFCFRTALLYPNAEFERQTSSHLRNQQKLQKPQSLLIWNTQEKEQWCLNLDHSQVQCNPFIWFALPIHFICRTAKCAIWWPSGSRHSLNLPHPKFRLKRASSPKWCSSLTLSDRQWAPKNCLCPNTCKMSWETCAKKAFLGTLWSLPGGGPAQEN